MYRIITIVITYNGSRWIDKCIGSLINSSIPMKILVIDNNSTDETPLLIKEKFPFVEVLETGKNIGFGKANNIGLQKALRENFDYVFLLNQDAWVEKDTIEQLITIQKANNHFGILAPLQLNGSGDLLDSLSLEYSLLPERKILSDAIIKRNLDDYYSIKFVNAACWLIPLSTIKTIGGFDPLYPHYGEDEDYLNRLSYHGLKIGLAVKTRVFHDREERNNTKIGKALTNEIFIRELIKLKKHGENNKSKYHYYKLILESIILFFISQNKSFYKCKVLAYLLIIKNYGSIINHKILEQEKRAHYL